MTNHTPALRSISSPPARLDPDLALTLAALTGRIGWFGTRARYIGSPPGSKARTALSERLAELNLALGYRDEKRLQRSLAAVFALTKTATDDRGRSESLIADYSALLKSLPTWAVVEACGQIARGQGESTTFAPAAPEIYRLAEAVARPFEDERAKISTVLSADLPERPEPGNVPRVAKGFQQLSAALGSMVANPREPERKAG